MANSYKDFEAADQRRSRNIKLILSGALAASMVAVYASREEEVDDPATPEPKPGDVVLNPDQIKNDEEQANNSYVQGVGYYHSVSHGWYHYPYNWYFPSRGYYHHGDWDSSPYVGPVPDRSRPTPDAIRSVHEGIRSGTILPRAGGSSARPAGAKSGISRGIFSAPHPSAHFGS